MSEKNNLKELCEQPWDMIVVGGGVTGAGVMREAVRLGLRTLLVEKNDFAWGTSSRSSKLVHGGLRYLKDAHFLLTRHSLVERERLLRESQELVTPLYFLAPIYKGAKPGRFTLAAGLAMYDLIAGNWDHQYYKGQNFQTLAPHLKEGAHGGFRYKDAQVDDARLVLRLIFEAEQAGGNAFNYVGSKDLIRKDGVLSGVLLQDQESGEICEARSKVVVNAAGVWAEELRKPETPCLRPLRGSHLVFYQWRLPASQAIMFTHPKDRRPMFLLPWEGVSIFGTTDVDHGPQIDQEACVSEEEVLYLMEALQDRFPALNLTCDDIISSFSGIRPIISKGDAKDPSKESRDHEIWDDQGLITITGGKLTTFRKMAFDLLKKAARYYEGGLQLDSSPPVFQPCKLDHPRLSPELQARLLGRYGVRAGDVVAAAGERELETIPNTWTTWVEMRWAARWEKVHKLEDLMLRRVRLGLLLEEGGAGVLDRVEAICRPELGWCKERWDEEVETYKALWRRCYGVPPSLRSAEAAHG